MCASYDDRALAAFDRAVARLLEMDHSTGVEQNANQVMDDGAVLLRVLFMEELEALWD